MSTNSQYGNPLFLSSLEASESAEHLTRVHLTKDGSCGAPADEAWLQKLIMCHPNLLPVDQIEPAFRFLVPICRELPIRTGSLFLDNLLVTPSGDLALVECKLWKNPKARREVVAQIIEYATAMSAWNYDALEAIDRARRLNGETPRKLYDLVSPDHPVLPEDTIDEASFHDAVSRNLGRGRFLLLIVGDGIHEGAEGMTEFLQQHAGFHFTLALVEIALFRKEGVGYIAQPRVIAKTTNIDRGIVTLVDGRVTVSPPQQVGPTSETPKRTTITQERYFEELEKNCPGVSSRLSAFLENLSEYNVHPEYGIDSLILRWRPDDGKSWNFGTITIRGDLWLDYLGQQAKSANLQDSYKKYLDRLAALDPNASVKETHVETAWIVVLNGKSIRIDALVADQTRRDGWLQAIREFQSAAMQGAEDND